MTEVRTRFAPSPTGFQHIGGFRTSFLAWLLARHNGGKFILRIEDTDQERKVAGAVKYLLEELAWLGVDIDEGPSPEELKTLGEYWEGCTKLGGPYGPYVQSLKAARYKEVAEQLISAGFAYRCDCSPEMLDKERLEQLARKELPGYSGYCRSRNISADVRHVVRFKMPSKRTISFNDAIRGRITWEAASLKDTVILKSDGLPLYHLAVVVDDHDMKITHALRGEEWIATTPLHLLIYEALGWEPPIFAHLPVVLGDDGKKLSKRHGATQIGVFRDQGYLPEALFNYVLLIGWSPGKGVEQEIFTKEEIIKRFSLEQINAASGVFDYNKLNWMNGMYIRAVSQARFTELARPFLTKANVRFDETIWNTIAPHVQERVKLLSEIPEMVEFLFIDNIARDLDVIFEQKGVDGAKAKEVLQRSRQALAGLPTFEVSSIEGALRPLAESLGLKAGAMFGVVRIAVTGKKITPPLFESICALGRERSLSRIDETLALLEARPEVRGSVA